MALHESGEMYLENILILKDKNETVRAIDLANFMNFSKPSVSRGLSLLKSGGYITVMEDGGINLTKKGKEKAEKIYEKHKILLSALVSLGVDEETARADACKIEHVISDTSFEKIKDRYGK
ncbi:MAG: metal-dependent transcriptional regulator [Bacillales bacterium]|nr:metal-dependent transcriptional regulator [Bacillales bacterium]